MKFPVSMLREFVETGLDAVQLGALLTMAGFELEGIEDVEGEPVLDIKVVSNRGDGLSVFGLAREVLAKDADARPTELYRRAVGRFAPVGAAPAPRGAHVSVETSDCTRYACSLYEAPPNGDSPEWLQKRMRQAGMRPISLLVDLTNYVMLELGQPLHAFDLDTLEGSAIVVRSAREGETLTTLNGDDHRLQHGQMMICDSVRPVAVAGVMGGQDTEVGPTTQRVLLESAHFVNTSVRRTRKQLGLSTEASYRFERSVDPEGVVAALHRFAELVGAVDGGKSMIPGVLDVYPHPLERQPIGLRMSRVVRLLGMPVSTEHARGYLERLGFAVRGDGEPFEVTPPTWRPDIVREDDLVEEVGRVHGYDKVPEELPAGKTTLGGVFGPERQAATLRQALVRLGLVQTMSHDLRDAHPLDSPNLQPIGPRNPHSPETAYLRTSLLPSLCDSAKRNGSKDVHLFEIGHVFAGGPEGPKQGTRLAVMSMGRIEPPEMLGASERASDFYAAKGWVEEALAALGLAATFEAGVADRRFHPTRSAVVLVSGEAVGLCGQIHPDAAAESGLPEAAVMAVIDLDKLPASAPRFGFHPISRNPAVRRDVAFLISKATPYASIESALAEACGAVLERQWLFDVYEGKGVPEGQHSLAVALQLRKHGANFTDEEANQVREKAVAALVSLGATLR